MAQIRKAGFPSARLVAKPPVMKIIAKNLSVVRGEELIFRDISFSVSQGTALIIRGANGAGKSSLLRAIAGLLPLNDGTLKFEDPDGEFGDAKLPELCHFLGHENAMKPSLTVGDNLRFWQDFSGQPHLDVEDALKMVGLAGLDPIPFAHLSTGQRRRSGIARLLVSYRPVWLLDEPTSGLDAASEAQFTALMEVHLENDGLIIAATHMPLGLSVAPQLELGHPL